MRGAGPGPVVPVQHPEQRLVRVARAVHVLRGVGRVVSEERRRHLQRQLPHDAPLQHGVACGRSAVGVKTQPSETIIGLPIADLYSTLRK